MKHICFISRVLPTNIKTCFSLVLPNAQGTAQKGLNLAVKTRA